MSGKRIFLPNEAAPRGAATLYVPNGHETGPLVIVGKCHTCDEEFGRGREEEWQKHVGWCARRNLDEIMQAREEQKKRTALFDDESWDPEISDHMKKVGETMLREGRMVVKKNERAGF